MIETNGPIRAFYETSRQQGVTFTLDDAGKLQVTLPDELKANVYYQDEVVKRAAWLKELAEMDGLMNRPLGPIDVDRLKGLAIKYGYELTWQKIDIETGEILSSEGAAAVDPDWHDPAVQDAIDRSYPSWLPA